MQEVASCSQRQPARCSQSGVFPHRAAAGSRHGTNHMGQELPEPACTASLGLSLREQSPSLWLSSSKPSVAVHHTVTGPAVLPCICSRQDNRFAVQTNRLTVSTQVPCGEAKLLPQVFPLAQFEGWVQREWEISPLAPVLGWARKEGGSSGLRDRCPEQRKWGSFLRKNLSVHTNDFLENPKATEILRINHRQHQQLSLASETLSAWW